MLARFLDAGLIIALAQPFGLVTACREDFIQDVRAELLADAETYNPALASETTFAANIIRRVVARHKREVVCNTTIMLEYHES